MKVVNVMIATIWLMALMAVMAKASMILDNNDELATERDDGHEDMRYDYSKAGEQIAKYLAKLKARARTLDNNMAPDDLATERGALESMAKWIAKMEGLDY